MVKSCKFAIFVTPWGGILRFAFVPVFTHFCNIFSFILKKIAESRDNFQQDKGILCMEHVEKYIIYGRNGSFLTWLATSRGKSRSTVISASPRHASTMIATPSDQMVNTNMIVKGAA